LIKNFSFKNLYITYIINLLNFPVLSSELQQIFSEVFKKTTVFEEIRAKLQELVSKKKDFDLSEKPVVLKFDVSPESLSKHLEELLKASFDERLGYEKINTVDVENTSQKIQNNIPEKSLTVTSVEVSNLAEVVQEKNKVEEVEAEESFKQDDFHKEEPDHINDEEIKETDVRNNDGPFSDEFQSIVDLRKKFDSQYERSHKLDFLKSIEDASVVESTYELMNSRIENDFEEKKESNNSNEKGIPLKKSFSVKAVLQTNEKAIFMAEIKNQEGEHEKSNSDSFGISRLSFEFIDDMSTLQVLIK
jgi:hypothetical protein